MKCNKAKKRCSKAIVKGIMAKRKKWRAHQVWNTLNAMGIKMQQSGLERNYFRKLSEITCSKSAYDGKFWYTWQEVK